MVKYLNSHNSSSFALRYFFNNVNGKGYTPLVSDECPLYLAVHKNKTEENTQSATTLEIEVLQPFALVDL
jgi:hypothetical protein